MLQAGLSSSGIVTVDNTGVRHQRNGHVPHICNDHFAWFKSTASKSRLNLLDIMRAGHQDYCYIGTAGIAYLDLARIAASPGVAGSDENAWHDRPFHGVESAVV
ncbi:hypothetical protein N9383_05215 [Granulosicoccus sp.]|nr:hypothetical protein [Granulosicoccus sp.]